MKPKNIQQFVIYSRKSKFTGKGESIENQIEMCRQYIATHYSKEEADAALVYEDEGFSGGTLERPQLKKMMKDSHRIEFAAIVVYRLDRISRNIGDFAKLIEELGDRKIDFISIREQFDTSSPMGRAMMYIASVFSQLERETIAERIRDNMNELAKTGRWLGGNTPTGYESESISYVSVDGKTRKACKLKTIPEEINLVKLIYDKFLETGSLTKTDQFLMRGYYKTKKGRNFSRFAIKSILTNPVYMIADEDAYDYFIKNDADIFADKEAFDGKHGIMPYNRTLQKPGKTNQLRPMNEWIVAVGKHKGVIPGAMWTQVQSLLELNKSKSYRKPRSNVALLSGILYCGKCGDYMRPKMTCRTNAAGEPIYTYLCTTKERSLGEVCCMKNASGNMLDAKIIETVKSLGKQSSELAKIITENKKRVNDDLDDYKAEVNNLKAQIENNEKSIKTLVTSLVKMEGTNAEKYVVEQIEELHKKGEALNKRLSDLEAVVKQHSLTELEFDVIRQILSSVGENIETYSTEQKRAAIRTFIRKIVWDGENAHVYLFHNDGDYEFPSPPMSPEIPSGEYSERYPIITDSTDSYVAPQVPSDGKWHTFRHLGSHTCLMIQNVSGDVKVAPLFIHSFPLLAPHHLLESEKFNIRFSDSSEITEIADKLRYHRYKKALLQREVAEYIGVDRSTYVRYEEYGHDYYPLDNMEKLATLFDVPVTDLLDDFNTFLYNDQGKQIREKRLSLHMTQREYADMLGVCVGNLKKWEQNRVRVVKSTWERLFK